ncbi:MAG TPA: glycosyl hydrolase family 65 protein [Spirochaetia bacterium]|nr:glycosyl hydrolase family 65 protein [Spirochaetia bacterium]
MEFNYQFDEFSESFFAGRDYCLLGNGYLRLVVQLKNNFGSSGNAILLNLLPSDDYRARRFLLLAHHAFKEMPSGVAVRQGGRFYQADSRQIGTESLRYEQTFERGIPTLRVRWQACYELSRDTTPRITDEQIEDVALAPGNIGLAAKGPSREEPRSPFTVTERIWCPPGLPAVIREVTVKNTSSGVVSGMEVWHFLAPNKLFLPHARLLSDKSGNGGRNETAASGYWGGARQFLGLACLDTGAWHLIAEYPNAIDMAAVRETPGRRSLRDPFMGPHLAAGARLPRLGRGQSATVRFAVAYGKTQQEMTAAARALRAEKTVRVRAEKSWDALTSVVTADARLDTLYRASKAGIRAAISSHEKRGRINAGILQYDAEWSRDHDFIAAAAAMNGQTDLAQDALEYALENLTDDRGHCFCGAAWAGEDKDYQIDTNGIRLWALWVHHVYTGETRLLRRHAPRIRSLLGVFFDPVRWVPRAGMLASTRDCWERWENCGLVPGFELEHQVWACMGLEKGADLAEILGDTALAARCRARATEIWDAVRSHPRYALMQSGHFMKRRTLAGAFQLTANAYRGARVGYLEPDSSEIQPILTGLASGSSAAARATLRRMEKLWNQDGLWKHGGYTRYNITSDPDQSSGPWPGVTILVARAALAARQWDVWSRAMDWVYRNAEPTWTLFEHYDYVAADKKNRRWYRGGIIPWLSFAEPSILMVQDLLGFRPCRAGIAIQPILPPGVRSLKARVPYRGHRVEVVVRGRGATCRWVRVDGKPHDGFDSRGAWLEPLDKSVKVELEFG